MKRKPQAVRWTTIEAQKRRRQALVMAPFAGLTLLMFCYALVALTQWPPT